MQQEAAGGGGGVVKGGHSGLGGTLPVRGEGGLCINKCESVEVAGDGVRGRGGLWSCQVLHATTTAITSYGRQQPQPCSTAPVSVPTLPHKPRVPSSAGTHTSPVVGRPTHRTTQMTSPSDVDCTYVAWLSCESSACLSIQSYMGSTPRSTHVVHVAPIL